MRIHNSSGLIFNFLNNGSIRSVESAPIRISLFETSPFTQEGANLYLRQRDGLIRFIPLIGPGANSLYKFSTRHFIARGGWNGLEYTCILQLSELNQSWQWNITVKNNGVLCQEVDLVHVQDVGLKTIATAPVNEYYISQYTERRIMQDQRFGSVLCCRQNMKESGGHPWLIMACSSMAESAATDGMLIYGASSRTSGIPEGLLSHHLGGEYAGESSIVALQSKPVQLAPGQEYNTSFMALFLPDHPEATSPTDLNILPSLLHSFDAVFHDKISGSFVPPIINDLSAASLLQSEDIDENELNHFFGTARRHLECDGNTLLSFFADQNTHVVLKAKENLVNRPHGNIIQANRRLEPCDSIMSTTAYACGVFNSHLTQGNTNFNSLLSVATNPFNLHRETGQRILVEFDNRLFLLGVPSAFEMGLSHCRWIYKYNDFLLQIITWTSIDSPQVNLYFRELNGKKVSLVITHDFDPVNNWRVEVGSNKGEFLVRPCAKSLIAQHYPTAQFRMIIHSEHDNFTSGGSRLLCDKHDCELPELFIFKVSDTDHFCMSFVGEVDNPAMVVKLTNPEKQWHHDCLRAVEDWEAMSCGLKIFSDNQHIKAINEALPWYLSNALIHFLTPYGLEQFGGAAWGTRDVSQGPVELLLACGKYSEARKTLGIIFSNQHTDGSWPQWWMFDRYNHIRSHEAHGDIIYWVLLALCNYVRTTGDSSILNDVLPFYHENGEQQTEKATVREHVNRVIALITNSFVKGTALVSYGGGDWNDSLQPVSQKLAERMISSWTVQMNYQAFQEYEEVCRFFGDKETADKLKQWCKLIRHDFKKHLIAGKVVAGYGYVNNTGTIELLLHPDDTTTGIKHSILPMNRGVLSGIFTSKQAENHQKLIEAYLKGPDGARLMDRPLKYQGGIQRIFQRAESSTFFGREIGLMYFHEHIRYAEALARTAKAAEFVEALRLAVPVNYRNIVKCSDLRQANCYYSSSDVVFQNRYQADEYYHELLACHHVLHGGWRVYSSGPGIFIALIIKRLFGIRIEYGNLVLDPVMPAFLDGLQAEVNLFGKRLKFTYRVKQEEFNPKKIVVNGKVIATGFEKNPYRKGGTIIPLDDFIAMLCEPLNEIEINL